MGNTSPLLEHKLIQKRPTTVWQLGSPPLVMSLNIIVILKKQQTRSVPFTFTFTAFLPTPFSCEETKVITQLPYLKNWKKNIWGQKLPVGHKLETSWSYKLQPVVKASKSGQNESSCLYPMVVFQNWSWLKIFQNRFWAISLRSQSSKDFPKGYR